MHLCFTPTIFALPSVSTTISDACAALMQQERARKLVTREASVACVAAYWLQVIRLYSAEQTRVNFIVQRLPSDEHILHVPLSSPISKAAGDESLEDSAADRLVYNATFVDIKHRLMRVRCWAPRKPGNLTRSGAQVDVVSGTIRSLFSRFASWFMPARVPAGRRLEEAMLGFRSRLKKGEM
jgi:hypothetical protein